MPPRRDAQAAAPLRVLVASHSHPALMNGGGELAAHALYRSLQAGPETEAWFLACSRDPAHARAGSTIVQPFSEREFLYTAGDFEWFNFANRDPRFPARFEALLHALQPQILHFHHYINFGVEAFAIAKRALPDLRIVLTLHEYLAICHHYGQMVTTGRHTLCHEATYARCHACFPERDPSDFFLRRDYIRSFFDQVDWFVAPSRFLAERYVHWGVPEAKLAVIENVVAPASRAPAPRPDDGVLRLGVFGQLSPLKGCDVVFDAAAILERDGPHDVVFDVYGDHRGQMPEFQARFLARLDAAGRNVAFHGPYDNAQVDALMAGVDAVVVPSVWWENSPLVIQEAMRNRRPVICSAIGGMAEKVRDGVDGFQFRAGSGAALAALARRLATGREALRAMASGMATPPAPDAVTAEHLRLYRRLLA